MNGINDTGNVEIIRAILAMAARLEMNVTAADVAKTVLKTLAKLPTLKT